MHGAGTESSLNLPHRLLNHDSLAGLSVVMTGQIR
jgi:hypothetical protein